MDFSRTGPRLRLIALLALAGPAVATSDLAANDALLTQRLVQANGAVLTHSGEGTWNESADQGAAASWQSSYVEASYVSANGATAAVGLGASAKSTVLHIVSVTQACSYSVNGFVAAYSESPAGLIPGDCSITFWKGDDVSFAFQSQTQVPYYEGIEFQAAGNLEPGVYTLSITSSSIGSGTIFGASYGSYASYGMNLSIVPAVCGDSDESCLLPHASPGCDVAWCCDSVCGADPFCCDAEWDVACAMSAAGCGISAPNDTCETAIPVADDDWVGNLGGSGGIELPRTCTDAEFAELNLPNYYAYISPVTGPVVIELEESTFDAMLAVYAGPCSSQILVACDDDSSKQGALQPRVVFDAICGQSYTIVVGGYGSAMGVARILIGASGSCGSSCPADFNGDGLVGPTDLAELLGAWGTAFPPADLDGSGLVGSSDLAVLLGGWGLCP